MFFTYLFLGDTFTDGTVDCTIPCTRGLSLRPIEIGAFHKFFSTTLEDRRYFRLGESLHGASIKTGLELVMRHNLLSLYCHNKKLESVREVLEFTKDFNRKLLNTLIHAFAKKDPMYSLVCFRKLFHVGVPTDVTYRGVIRAYRRVNMDAGMREGLPRKIIMSMNTYEVLVDWRHRVALVDMLLGGGLVDAAKERMTEDNLLLDEKMITSFLHAFTAEKIYTDPPIEDPEKLDKCKRFVAELEEKGIHYTIYDSLRTRLEDQGIELGTNVTYCPDYRLICWPICIS